MLGDELIRYRLAGIAVLHADHKTIKIVDAAHPLMPRRIDHERLSGQRIGRAKVSALSASRLDRRAGSDAVISAGIEAGENAVEVGAVVANELPCSAELAGNALHQRDIEARRAILPDEFKRWIGQRGPDLQRGGVFGDFRSGRR